MRSQTRSKVRYLGYVGLMFYLIYQPDLLKVGDIGVAGINVILMVVMILLSTRRELSRLTKGLWPFLVTVICASTWFAIKALQAGFDPRLFQNTYVVIQIINVCLGLMMFSRRGGDDLVHTIGLLLNVAMVQFAISLLMVASHGFRSWVLQFADEYLTGNQWIVAERLYGLSGEYTFFTPTYHSILVVLAVYLCIHDGMRYAFYLAPLLVMIVLNGRIGLATSLAGSLVLLLCSLVGHRKQARRTIAFTLFTVFVILPLGVLSVSLLPEANRQWLTSGFQDVVQYLTTGQRANNMTQLADSFLFFPTGWHWLWGYGTRVYYLSAQAIGLGQSDIGYINDLFMGGLIYIGILYSGIIQFLFKGFRTYPGLAPSLLAVLAIANYKGEAMRSGLILCMLIALAYIAKPYALPEVKSEMELAL